MKLTVRILVVLSQSTGVESVLLPYPGSLSTVRLITIIVLRGVGFGMITYLTTPLDLGMMIRMSLGTIQEIGLREEWMTMVDQRHLERKVDRHNRGQSVLHQVAASQLGMVCPVIVLHVVGPQELHQGVQQALLFLLCLLFQCILLGTLHQLLLQ